MADDSTGGPPSGCGGTIGVIIGILVVGFAVGAGKRCFTNERAQPTVIPSGYSEPRYAQCPGCLGSGVVTARDPYCGGAGQHQGIDAVGRRFPIKCAHCNGLGTIQQTCGRCGGSGTLRGQ
jgi:hypothetical protein